MLYILSLHLSVLPLRLTYLSISSLLTLVYLSYTTHLFNHSNNAYSSKLKCHVNVSKKNDSNEKHF